MTEIHPLKRKSIKPSSSTVRGMLPGPQFRALDAAMQSVRSAGLRLDWKWRNRTVGWVCEGLLDATVVCELQPTAEPLLGVINLEREIQEMALASAVVPKKFKKILELPIEENKKTCLYEFPLGSTRMRDLLSEFVECLVPLHEESRKK